jgi:hypothetical protein
MTAAVKFGGRRESLYCKIATQVIRPEKGRKPSPLRFYFSCALLELLRLFY